MNLIYQREAILLAATIFHSASMAIALGVALKYSTPNVRVAQLVPIVLASFVFAISVVYFRSLRARRLGNLLATLKSIATPVSAAIVCGVLADILMGFDGISRPEVFFRGLIYIVLVHASLQSLISMYLQFREAKQRPPSIVIAGNNARSTELIEGWRQNSLFPIEIIGYIDEPIRQDYMPNPNQATIRHLGNASEVEQILLREVVDEVWMTLPMRSQFDQVNRIVRTCETIGVPVRLSPGHIFDADCSALRRTDGHWADELSFVAMPGKPWKLVVKRLVDLFASTAALVIFSPLFMVLAIIIKTTSAGPVFFTQVRCGLHGRRFKILKFRTMVADADAKKAELEAENEAEGPVFKMKKDPRITRVGSILRKTSLDELPQLWNVFAGEMSLVGPRPPVPSEVAQYKPWQRRRLSVKPGITCTWQVSGRNHITFDRWMEMDLEYIRDWSLRKDLFLLLKTVPAVVFMRGAY